MDTSDDIVERFLEVLAETGVTTAELRRLYGCDPEADLETTVRREVGDDRTVELLRALEATGRSLRFGNRVTADDGESLAAALERYGYSIEVSDDGAELEVVAFDAVTTDIHRFRTAPDPVSVREALESTLLGPAGLTVVDLVDGSALVADRRAIDRLRAAYGDRIAPFGEPVLRSESESESKPEPKATADRQPDAGGNSATTSDEPTADDSGSAAVGGSSDAGDVVESDGVAADPGPDDLSTVFEKGRRYVEEEPEPESGRAAAATESESKSNPDEFEVRGGPTTAVSASSIDDVFDELETSGGDSDESDAGGALAGSEPRTTVSDTSADDILARATGETTFDEVAARAGEADPDAILDDADDALVEES